MENNNNKVTIGCLSPLAVIIFLAFFFAKIFDKIDWSWWWVFSPLWIPLAIITVIVACIGLVWSSVCLYDICNKKWK